MNNISVKLKMLVIACSFLALSIYGAEKKPVGSQKAEPGFSEKLKLLQPVEFKFVEEDKPKTRFGLITEHLPDPLYGLSSDEVEKLTEELAKELKPEASITEIHKAYKVKAEKMRKAKTPEKTTSDERVAKLMKILEEMQKERESGKVEQTTKTVAAVEKHFPGHKDVEYQGTSVRLDNGLAYQVIMSSAPQVPHKGKTITYDYEPRWLPEDYQDPVTGDDIPISDFVEYCARWKEECKSQKGDKDE